MTDKEINAPSDEELASEIEVPTEWAEAQMANGLLTLTQDQIEALTGRATINLPADLIKPLLSPRERSAPIEWIKPLDAVRLLSQRLGGDDAAKTSIAARLRDGAIECSSVWMSEGPDIGPVSSRRPNFPIAGSKDNLTCWVTPIHKGLGPPKLGSQIWSQSDDWDADLKRWDWREGLFVTSYHLRTTIFVDGIPTKELKSKSRRRWVVSGIRFSLEDIANILGEDGPRLLGRSQQFTGDVKTKPKKRGKTGPRQKKWNFAPVLAQIESQIESGEISHLGKVDDYGMLAKLEDKIRKLMTGEDGKEPAEATVRRKAQSLRTSWRIKSDLPE